jgi:DUF4097 and DUF4098 domain-containing protein YvlB
MLGREREVAALTPEPGPDTATRRYPRWLVAVSLCAAVVVLAGGAFVWLRVIRATGTQRVAQQHVHEREITRLEVESASGSISVAQGRRGRVVIARHLRWASAKPEIREEWFGTTLRISHRCAKESECSVDYLIQAPADVVVDARTKEGDLAIRDIIGDLRLSTSAGNLEVVNAHGKLRARAAGGGITAHGLHSPRTEVEAEDGDLELQFVAAPSEVEALSSSGSIKVSLPGVGADVPDGRGYAVRASTEAGSLRVDVRQDVSSGRTIDAHTHEGDIDINYAR